MYVTYAYSIHTSTYTCTYVYVNVCMLNVTPCCVVPAFGVTECCRDSPSASKQRFSVRRLRAGIDIGVLSYCLVKRGYVCLFLLHKAENRLTHKASKL